MTITARAALDIQTARELTVERVAGGWITRTSAGARVRVEPEFRATPEEAIEAAEAHLAAREAEHAERSRRQLVDLMQRGDFYHHPRTVRGGGPEAGDRIVFDLLRTADDLVIVAGAASVVEAWTAERGEAAGGPPR